MCWAEKLQEQIQGKMQGKMCEQGTDGANEAETEEALYESLSEEDQVMSSVVEASISSNNEVCFVPSASCAVPTLPKPALRFVKDVTYPDGIVVVPGTVFSKIWRVRNDGKHPWPQGVLLVNAGGDILSDPAAKEPLPVLAAGEEMNISTQLRAPECSGRFNSYFRVQTAEGSAFGQRLWASIVVSEDESDWHLVRSTSAAPVETIAAVAPVPIGDAPALVASPFVQVTETAVEAGPASTFPPAAEGKGEPVSDASPPTPPADELKTTPREPPVRPVPATVARWLKELRLLNEMGFDDEGLLIELLETHCQRAASQGGGVDTEGLQKVVAELLLSFSHLK